MLAWTTSATCLLPAGRNTGSVYTRYGTPEYENESKRDTPDLRLAKAAVGQGTRYPLEPFGPVVEDVKMRRFRESTDLCTPLVSGGSVPGPRLGGPYPWESGGDPWGVVPRTLSAPLPEGLSCCCASSPA